MKVALVAEKREHWMVENLAGKRDDSSVDRMEYRKEGELAGRRVLSLAAEKVFYWGRWLGN